MKYNDITPAFFISRPNRFIAKIKLDGKELSVHVEPECGVSEVMGIINTLDTCLEMFALEHGIALKST